MKKINHWINGKNVAGADYFHTTNPATGEVLAEVASGGEAEINQAVAAAKEAFPKWANLPMKERARLLRRPTRLHPFAPNLLAALVGVTTVGLVDSLIDIPRITLFLTLLLWLALNLRQPAAR